MRRMLLLRTLLATFVLFARGEEAPEVQPDAAAAEAEPAAAEPIEDVPLNCKSHGVLCLWPPCTKRCDGWTVNSFRPCARRAHR